MIIVGSCWLAGALISGLVAVTPIWAALGYPEQGRYKGAVRTLDSATLVSFIIGDGHGVMSGGVAPMETKIP